MAQRIPLPLTVSCFRKIQIGFTFLVPAHPGSPGQGAVKWVCVCLPTVCFIVAVDMMLYLYNVVHYIHAMLNWATRCAMLQAFSTPWFLYANPTNHHLVFFLLEVFNNIIQYQFDGLTLHVLSLSLLSYLLALNSDTCYCVLA